VKRSLKICFHWLQRLWGAWRRRKGYVKPLPVVERKKPYTYKTRLERIRERWPGFRFVSTDRGGLNMPKYQPCPVCGKGSKRRNKTMGGADYCCPVHGVFFVRA